RIADGSAYARSPSRAGADAHPRSATCVRGRLHSPPARWSFLAATRHNGTVNLTGVLGYLAEAGRGSYRRAAGPEHGQPRRVPQARYAVFGTVKSNEAPVDLPTEQMLVIRRATVLSARMPLDLVMPF